MIKSSKLVNLVLVSSTVLGMVVTAGTSTAMAAAKTSADTSSVMTKKDNSPRIDYQTSGTLAASGTAMDGLELIAGNQVTRGTLHMKYDVKSFAALNWQEHTVTTIKLPREFNAFAKDGSLLKYIASANFNYTSSINTINHSYTSNEMHIEKDTQSDDTYLLKFDNPTVTGIGLNVQMHVEFDLNLGDMVTDTGVRIPDAYDKSAYHLASTITDKDDAGIIDWHLVGNTNGATTIPIWQLDPGYDILKQAPTIHNLIYDTDTVVTGSGIPGAKITLRQGVQPDSPIIGTGEVDASGVYSITIPAHNAGVTISATQNAGFGESSSTTATVQHKGGEIPAPGVPENQQLSDKTVKGTGYAPGNSIVVTNQRTGESVTTTVQADKSYLVNVSSTFWKLFDIINVQEKNSSGDVSKVAQFVVIPDETK